MDTAFYVNRPTIEELTALEIKIDNNIEIALRPKIYTLEELLLIIDIANNASKSFNKKVLRSKKHLNKIFAPKIIKKQ